MSRDVAPSSTRYRALIQLLRTAEDLWNASRIFFARWDLSPSQFNVLNLLFSQPEGLSQSELSRLLIMHRSNATGLVDRLERRGLLRREDVPGDRRAYRVVLTPQGQALLEEIYPHYYAASEQVWAQTPDAKVEELLAELQQLTRNAAEVARQDPAVALPDLDTAVSPARSEARGGRRASRILSAPTQVPAALGFGTALGSEDDPLRTSDL